MRTIKGRKDQGVFIRIDNDDHEKFMAIARLDHRTAGNLGSKIVAEWLAKQTDPRSKKLNGSHKAAATHPA
jgi:hypothetical protein